MTVVAQKFRICKTCNQSLPATTEFFHKHYTRLRTSCKACRAKHYSLTKKQPKIKRAIITPDGKKCCTICGECNENTEEFFYILDKKHYPRLDTICKNCRRVKNKRAYHEIPGRREKILEINRTWTKNNPEKSRIYQLTAQKKHRLGIHTSISGAIIKCIKGTRKTFPTKYVGCSKDEFKTYFESLFEDWMNWDNYGLYQRQLPERWTIDHIVPKSRWQFGSLDGEELEEALKQCWHYTNLMPLHGKINTQLGAKK